MNDFVADLKSIFEAFQEENKSRWNSLIERANENTLDKPETHFCSKSQPYFYSGKLIDRKSLKLLKGVKYLIITMNPALIGDKDCRDSAPYDILTESLNDFIERQNKWFEEFADQRSTSMIYNFSNKSLKFLNGEDEECEGVRYGYLRKYAVVVDWFPFYSKNFVLKKVNDLPDERLRLILSLAKELKTNKIIALGSDIKNSLDLLMKKTSANEEFSKYRLDKYVFEGMTVYSYLVGYKSDDYFKNVARLINKDCQNE
ncbi:hypothetical protein [Chondrinema litorale]|uniref:hypothetical protein n=1 Tax=Chondrinema litorale TaxID=2994555 RepID=UPI002543A9A8|nr:hypothetical protein [Chondrinema litorale]UZR99845.1 hypothetical protein OQ292_38310 [Chondrinema litorale]